jgi:SAM-dependent MidA family methyltransferase
MKFALYSPDGGYYRSHTPIGSAGDYFTSPTAHPTFGTLIAAQLEQMWEILGKPSPFTVLEAGAGNGVLARDIAQEVQTTSPEFSRSLRYVALDYAAPDNLPSSLNPIAAAGVPLRGLVGCILTNELIDALPVHRFRVHDGSIHEVFVDASDDKFVEMLQEPTNPLITHRVTESTQEALPEGYKGEVCFQADAWLTEASAALERGFVLTVDYGGTTKELYSPQREGGTLRCHYKHVVSGNPYVRVGRQDITAHVDFTALKESGEHCGLEVLGYTTQREFLTNLGVGSYLEALASQSRAGTDYGSGALPRQAYLANRMGMQELLQPEGLGNFKVMIQGKGVSSDDLWGFTPDNLHQSRLQRDLATLHVPLLTSTHTPLMEGKYPHHHQDIILDLNSLTDI